MFHRIHREPSYYCIILLKKQKKYAAENCYILLTGREGVRVVRVTRRVERLNETHAHSAHHRRTPVGTSAVYRS